MHGTRAVVHVGQHQHGHIRLQGGGQFICFHQLQGEAALFAQGLGNVEVGRKIGALAQYDALLGVVCLRNRHSRAQHFEQVDGRAVSGNHFVFFGANQLCNFVAHLQWHVEPPSGVPTFNQVLPPCLIDRSRHACRCGFGQDAQ